MHVIKTSPATAAGILLLLLLLRQGRLAPPPPPPFRFPRVHDGQLFFSPTYSCLWVSYSFTTFFLSSPAQNPLGKKGKFLGSSRCKQDFIFLRGTASVLNGGGKGEKGVLLQRAPSSSSSSSSFFPWAYKQTDGRRGAKRGVRGLVPPPSPDEPPEPPTDVRAVFSRRKSHSN